MRFRARRRVGATTDAPGGAAAPTDLDRLVEAVSALPLGFVVEDASGRPLVVNGVARSPAGEVQGDVLATAALQRVLAAAHGGESSIEVLELRGAAPRTFELRAAPLAAGGVMAMIVDVSERRRLDAIRRDFVANVNHELRTPIGALGVLAEALVEQTDAEVVRRLSARIVDEADRASRLLEDLLDFSRVEEGAAPPERVVLAEVVSAAVDRVAALAERRRVTLRLGTDAAGPGPAAAVDGDREQLVSAVANLVDNAVKYSDEGSVVEVDVLVEGTTAAVVVRDEGSGIPAKDLDRVFERFYRVDRARDRRTGGTGLGLAIVRHVATNHGGDVSVVSQEGVGSTFALRLPLAGAES